MHAVKLRKLTLNALTATSDNYSSNLASTLVRFCRWFAISYSTVAEAACLAICLTAASNNDGAAVTIQSCTGSAAQKWTFAGNGQVTVYGNKCLDVTDGKNADGTKMQIWTCSTNNPNQKWDYNVRLHASSSKRARAAMC